MAKDLDIRLEILTYAARFAKPLFGLWGKGGQILAPLHEALSPYGVTLGNIVVHAAVANAAEPLVTVWVRGNSTVKFAFDRVEFALHNFTQDFFEAFPKLFEDSTKWLKKEVPQFKFASHNLAYFCHCMVRGSNPKAVLDAIHPKPLKSAGLSRGNASTFNSAVASKNWTTRIAFDHSLAIPGALFIGLFIDTNTEELDYNATLIDARAYFRSILAEVDLTLPELAQSKDG